MSNNICRLRRVTYDDAELLLEWANDPNTRESAIHSHQIALEEHMNWFSDKMSDENCRMYIYEVDGIPIGQVRVDIDGNVGEIDYSIASGYRGAGHASRMMQLLEQCVIGTVDKLVARVKITNVASQVALSKSGYFTDGLMIYEKVLTGTDENIDVVIDKTHAELPVNSSIASKVGGVILLTNNANSLPVYEFLCSHEDNVSIISEPVTYKDLINLKPSFVISYNYNYMIRRDVIDLLPDRIINMHISILPWNRGMDPNAWSFIEDTPKGVTIHKINEKLDDGEILLQQSAAFDEDTETLQSSYDKLQEMIQKLFTDNWDIIKENRIAGYRNPSEGTFHYGREFIKIRDAIDNFEWSMSISDFKREVQRVAKKL